MKLNRKLLTILVALLILPLSFLKGQDEKINYGKAPDEIFPFDKFTKAHEYFFLKPIECYSAGREIPPPKNLKEVRIGFLGPLEGSMIIDLGTQMLRGSEMAIDEANAKGGYNGIPFKLMVHNDVGLWGAAANEIVSMDDEGVWAWLGSIDDIVSHVALRATLKMEIPEVCTGDPDPTFTETNIPWMIRVISDDRQSAYALAHQIFTMDKHSRVGVIRTGSRYGRVAVKIFSETAVRLGHPMIIEERFADGESDFKSQLERIKKVKPDAILIWGNARESALILNQIRELGMTQPVYGSDRMVSAKFLEMAGKNAEGIVTTCQYNPDDNNPRLKAFQANYLRKYGEKPEVFAAHAYDGMNIIIDAIRKAGLNRVLIRDLLTDQKTFQGYRGITGKLVLDGSWNDIGDIYLAKFSNGKFMFTLAPPPSEIEQHTSSTADY
jgi:ABC-type branched-subunit amino acid transport system substrate-binding protein